MVVGDPARASGLVSSPRRGRSATRRDGARAHPPPVCPVPGGAAAAPDGGRSPPVLRFQRLLAVHAASSRPCGGAVAAAAICAACLARRAVSPAMVAWHGEKAAAHRDDGRTPSQMKVNALLPVKDE